MSAGSQSAWFEFISSQASVVASYGHCSSPARKRSLFLSFPCVCPEPVLVK
jgi:hypothetical protein